MHKSTRERRIKGPGGYSGKAIVIGLLERHGEVRCSVIPDAKHNTLHEQINQHVESGAEVFTDEWRSYFGLNANYIHQVINHAEEYVRGNVHTNSIENFWSLLKRSIKGTYVSVEPFHLFRYLDEQSFRFNTRKGKDADRFNKLAGQVAGKRLTYKGLTGKLADDEISSH
jgi:transposase-like protein